MKTIRILFSGASGRPGVIAASLASALLLGALSVKPAAGQITPPPSPGLPSGPPPAAAVASPGVAASASITSTNAPASTAARPAAFPAFPAFPTMAPPATEPSATAVAPGATAPAAAAQTGSRLPLPTVPFGAGDPAATRTAAARVDDYGLLFGKDPNEIFPADSLQLSAMDLTSVFEVYEEYSGRIVLRNSAIPEKGTLTLKVPIPLTRLEVVETLNAALSENGITMIPFGDKWVKAVPAAQSGAEGMSISKEDAKQLPMAEQFVTQVIQLKHARPSELKTILSTFSKNPTTGIIDIDPSMILVIRDYASNVKRIAELVAKIDRVPPDDYRLEVIPVRYGKVDDLYATMSSLVGGSGGGVALGGGVGARRNTGVTSRGGSAFGGQQNQFGQVGQNQFGNNGLAQSPGAAFNNFQNRVSQVTRSAGAAGAGAQNQVLYDARIVPDERSNSLLVYASERDMIMITNIVARVDRQMPQVLIEAVVLDVTLNKSMSVGVSYLQNPQTSGKFTGASGANNGQQFLSSIQSVTNIAGGLASGFNVFARYGGTLEAAVQALASDSSVSVISRPRIQTSHAVPGSFVIGTSVPYITGFVNYSGYVGGASSSSTVNEKDIVTDFEVTPYITPDGLVVMDIDNKFDEPGETITIDGNPYPTVNERHAASTLTVNDGETIMLGGYITTTKSKSYSGVPYLMNMPLFGALFRSKSTDNTREELIVLMRAKVLWTPEDASAFAAREQSTLPGVRGAENDERRLRNAELKAVEKRESKDSLDDQKLDNH